jgi:hypothetical protein
MRLRPRLRQATRLPVFAASDHVAQLQANLLSRGDVLLWEIHTSDLATIVLKATAPPTIGESAAAKFRRCRQHMLVVEEQPLAGYPPFAAPRVGQQQRQLRSRWQSQLLG